MDLFFSVKYDVRLSSESQGFVDLSFSFVDSHCEEGKR
jgi:hypothetical protein